MQKIIAHYFSLLEQSLEDYSFGNQPAELYEPIDYIMSLGGKRLRPILVLLSYALFKKDIGSVLHPALSVEVFHNFTLMHDDIMDQAPLRRGKDTVHKKWDENVAILSGDVMLVKAYELLMGAGGDHTEKIIRRFSKTAAEVCEGQQLDMNYENTVDIGIEQYLEMIRLKTAVLLGFSLELGAILANTPEDMCKELHEAGIKIGIGFQLMDDLLDVYADSEKFGKQVGGDIIANKKTFLLLKSIELADHRQKRELAYWITKDKFDAEEKINSVKLIYDELNIRKITGDLIERYFKEGIQNIKHIQTPNSKKDLLGYIDYLRKREK